MRTEPNNKRKQQTQTTNANNKRKQQTQATNASTNGGDASRVIGKRCCYYFVACVFPSFLYSDAGTRLLKNSPMRDASPPLVVAFRGSAWR